MKIIVWKKLNHGSFTPRKFGAGGRELSFGRGYIIPTPFDPRLLAVVPKAVFDAAKRGL